MSSVGRSSRLMTLKKIGSIVRWGGGDAFLYFFFFFFLCDEGEGVPAMAAER